METVLFFPHLRLSMTKTKVAMIFLDVLQNTSRSLNNLSQRKL
jgi:hypothetical protein